MRFDIYGRYQLEVVRKNERWKIYRLDNGKRREVTDLVIPALLPSNELATYLDDILHELAGPGDFIRHLE